MAEAPVARGSTISSLSIRRTGFCLAALFGFFILLIVSPTFRWLFFNVVLNVLASSGSSRGGYSGGSYSGGGYSGGGGFSGGGGSSGGGGASGSW